ncbi:hypothetical protein Tel_01925 [Candidatus Tenderia electrophaga]|jgi:hypothetical protein|uniref:Uncharacterized protein n=1 Tax=Candidatus Tenderia electrophaga TaxID=1748243 RepID=A0A0S2TA68_9GAMM|nr:hypothetical protein Tel_01925 [Candidatus Tenderia electrophaga]
MSELAVVIGGWYQAPGGQIFEVVALDPDEQSIDIQYFDGEVEELDFDTWEEMVLEEAQPPEDWTGAFDEIERDDLGYSDTAMRPENWSGALGALDAMESED